MKYFTIFAFLFVIFVAYTTAQRCAGRPRTPACTGARDVGRRGIGCTSRSMWYYNTRLRQCRQMRYLGCYGNNNRHCTRASCEQRCRR